MSLLEQNSIIAWLQNKKTETGQPIDLASHYFLYDIYRDFSPIIAVQKPAQVGLTTTQLFKTFWGMKRYGLDAIYTMPTVSDANEISKGKINRLIAQNPDLEILVKELDTMSQKMVGENILYIRGTWTEKSAMSHSSDWNLYDEVDASKQDVIEQYSTRLQHSKFKWEHYFSHPSSENVGVNKVFAKSDQKHWFIRCKSCNKEQFLEFPKNVCFEREVYVCKYCNNELSDRDRAIGRWVKKYKNREISGYQINLLMATWTTAKELIGYYNDKSPEYFTNKVLGLPYVGAGNKVTWEVIRKNITTDVNDQTGRIVIGVDTGTTTWYVVGNKNGIFYYGSCTGYDEIEALLKRYKNSIAVFDQGGDLMKPRELQEKYGAGRIYLCHYSVDRKTQELVRWGEKENRGTVVVDRNRMIQLLVDELSDGRIPLQQVESEQDWHDYYVHWSNIYRTTVENSLGVPVKKWERSGDDHWVHATVYWRTAISKFAGEMAKFVGTNPLDSVPLSPEIDHEGKMKGALVFESNDGYDWRV